MFKNIFNLCSLIELNTQNSNPIFKIKIYCANETKNTKIHLIFLICFGKFEKQIKIIKFISYYLYKFHNSPFVNFVSFVFLIFYIHIYIYIYTYTCSPPFQVSRPFIFGAPPRSVPNASQPMNIHHKNQYELQYPRIHGDLQTHYVRTLYPSRHVNIHTFSTYTM